MADILHRLGIRAPIERVYKAVATIEGLSEWWTEETAGESKVGGEIEFTFRSTDGHTVGLMRMKVDALVEGEQVRWTCLEGPPEWQGTHFSFDLKFEDDMTILNFAHSNWKEPSEGMAHCTTKWCIFLMSLRDYVLSGQGRPSPNDIKIDNWN